MGVLYITNKDYHLKKLGPRITILDKTNKTVCNVLIREVERLILTSPAQMTTELVLELLANDIPIMYMPDGTNTSGVLVPIAGKVTRVMNQVRIAQNKYKTGNVVRKLLHAKLQSQQKLLERFDARMHKNSLSYAVAFINEVEKKIDCTYEMRNFKFYEKIASEKYYSCFPLIISQEKFQWSRNGDSLDPMNIMLDFSTNLLANEITILLRMQGLNITIGYFHNLEDYENGLVLDFMFPFLSGVVDRAVLNAINLGLVSMDDFKTKDEDGTLVLTEEAKRKWYPIFTASLNRMNIAKTMTYNKEISKMIREFSKELN
mgnify:CR=1 FL=1